MEARYFSEDLFKAIYAIEDLYGFKPISLEDVHIKIIRDDENRTVEIKGNDKGELVFSLKENERALRNASLNDLERFLDDYREDCRLADETFRKTTERNYFGF